MFDNKKRARLCSILHGLDNNRCDSWFDISEYVVCCWRMPISVLITSRDYRCNYNRFCACYWSLMVDIKKRVICLMLSIKIKVIEYQAIVDMSKPHTVTVLRQISNQKNSSNGKSLRVWFIWLFVFAIKYILSNSNTHSTIASALLRVFIVEFSFKYCIPFLTVWGVQFKVKDFIWICIFYVTL